MISSWRWLLFAVALSLPVLPTGAAAAAAGPSGLAAAVDGTDESSSEEAAPVTVKIPVLGVEAPVVPVGEDPDGAMSAPEDPDTVAWWSLGPGTGVVGNIVLAGHVDWGGRLRVFGLINRLTPGDEIIIIDELGREFHYQVVWSRQVAADGAPIEEIFGSSDVPEVTLITCGGVFDRSTRQYLDRIIVRAQVARAARG